MLTDEHKEKLIAGRRAWLEKRKQAMEEAKSKFSSGFEGETGLLKRTVGVGDSGVTIGGKVIPVSKDLLNERSIEAAEGVLTASRILVDHALAFLSVIKEKVKAQEEETEDEGAAESSD